MNNIHKAIIILILNYLYKIDSLFKILKSVSKKATDKIIPIKKVENHIKSTAVANKK